MMDKYPAADVPCNGCTACCKHSLIVLKPEHGDIIGLYDTKDVIDPLTGRQAKAIKQRRDGACIYLGDKGCSVYEFRPVICKAFDCRRYWRNFESRAARRQAVRRRYADPAVLEAGKERQASLKLGEAD